MEVQRAPAVVRPPPPDFLSLLTLTDRTLARSFSAALDEMFKLEGVGALELSLDQK